MLSYFLPSFPNLNKSLLTTLWEGNPKQRNGVCLLKLFQSQYYMEMDLSRAWSELVSSAHCPFSNQWNTISFPTVS